MATVATGKTAGTATGVDALMSLMAVVLVFAPLIRSGQTPLALMMLQFMAVAILFVMFWRSQGLDRLTRREFVGILALLAIPVLYLVPLPASIFAALPGRETYNQILEMVAGEGDSWRPLSLYPQETLSAWLALLPPIAVYLGARACSANQLMRLLLIVMTMAGVQVLLGLMQYGAGRGPLFLGMEPISRAIGTYTNPNHLAGMIELVLPVVLGIYIYSIGRRDPSSGRAGFRQRMAFLATARGHQAFWFGTLAVLLIVGVIFTRSRAGIGLTILGILLATMFFSRRIGGDNVYGKPGTIVAAAIGFGVAIGLGPVFDRFSALDTVENHRVTMWTHTLDGIGAFFPFGSGPGTYPDVFPAFQPLELGRWFINHAHNDYLEWLFEGGILMAALMIYLIGVYFWQWPKVLRKGREWTRYSFIQVGSGIGMFLLLLHELVDYNLMMPANAVYFAFFASIFMRDFGPDEVAAKRPRRTRHMQQARAFTPTPAHKVTAATERAPLDPRPDTSGREAADWNPFMDDENSDNQSAEKGVVDDGEAPKH